MLELLLQMAFAVFIFTGVVYFPIFFWLKTHQSDDNGASFTTSQKRNLKATLAGSH